MEIKNAPRELFPNVNKYKQVCLLRMCEIHGGRIILSFDVIYVCMSRKDEEIGRFRKLIFGIHVQLSPSSNKLRFPDENFHTCPNYYVIYAFRKV